MMDGFGMGFGGGFMWLIWIPLILLVVWAVAGFRPGSDQSQRTPRQLLDERYARGEIDDEEYQKRRVVLGG